MKLQETCLVSQEIRISHDKEASPFWWMFYLYPNRVWLSQVRVYNYRNLVGEEQIQMHQVYNYRNWFSAQLCPQSDPPSKPLSRKNDLSWIRKAFRL